MAFYCIQVQLPLLGGLLLFWGGWGLGVGGGVTFEIQYEREKLKPLFSRGALLSEFYGIVKTIYYSRYFPTL